MKNKLLWLLKTSFWKIKGCLGGCLKRLEVCLGDLRECFGGLGECLKRLKVCLEDLGECLKACLGDLGECLGGLGGCLEGYLGNLKRLFKSMRFIFKTI